VFGPYPAVLVASVIRTFPVILGLEDPEASVATSTRWNQSASAGVPGPRAETALRPVAEKERIVSIDALRGFALLGILYMNIQAFSMVSAAYMNPTAYGDLQGANYAVWLAGHLLADLKFMSIFSMLFGAGIFLMGKVERVGQLAMVLAIWAFQLVVSPVWLRYFLFGPLEWLWRSLTYLQWEPFRRPAAA
jgi:uncharacterized membrane protein YeiB